MCRVMLRGIAFCRACDVGATCTGTRLYVPRMPSKYLERPHRDASSVIPFCSVYAACWCRKQEHSTVVVTETVCNGSCLSSVCADTVHTASALAVTILCFAVGVRLAYYCSVQSLYTTETYWCSSNHWKHLDSNVLIVQETIQQTFSYQNCNNVNSADNCCS
jgi:hypothetical protein